jgi:putative nucleotidyltransferase with HDIG domain
MATHRIPVARLKPGMYVLDPGISWLREPLLYMREGIIADQEEINDIIRQGFTEVICDPDRFAGSLDNFAKPSRTPPMATEMPLACETYSNAYARVKQYMEAPPGSSPDVLAQEPCVKSIILSLKRDASAILALANLKGLDEYTYRHSVNVAVYAVAFARYLGLSDKEQQLVGLAGLFHDYGKALVPKEILNAPRTLSPEEFTVMRSHVLLGYEKLCKIPNIPVEILDGIAQHHEMHDGSGYPYGLSGSQIGLFGRILSLCDVYDALSSKRVYKDAILPNQALGVMYRMGGTAWAHGYVEHFIKMIGIFPIGTAVRLSNGQRGIVCHSDAAFPALPDVILVQDEDGTPRLDYRLDLRQQTAISVTCSLSLMETVHWNIPALLGITPTA